jgi:hypothetical protein
MIFEGSRDNTLREISNATTAASTKKKVKLPSAKEEGTIYVASSGGYYEAPTIDTAKITDLIDNIYVQGVIQKQLNLIFQEKYTIEVKDAKTKAVDEELSNTMMDMCETKSVRLWAQMQKAYVSKFLWGIHLINPIWGVDPLAETTEIRLLALRHLPSETFKTAPAGQLYTYSQILPGITLDDKDELVFWQEPKPGFVPEQIKNVFYIKNPSDRGLAGDPIIVPMLPIIEMLKFTWNTEMQQVNRIGAKILFIKVTNPQPASTRNGSVGDIDYANAIIKNWGKDTAFQLRENMELIDLNLKDDSNNLDIIEALSNIIIGYVSPAEFIGNKNETRIGGNDNAQKELLDNYIKGIHQWLSEQFEMLLMRYLEYNSYTGYSVTIKIPPPMHDSRDEMRKDAEAGFLTQSLDQNELRKLLRHPAKADADLVKLSDYYSKVSRTEQLIKV